MIAQIGPTSRPAAAASGSASTALALLDLTDGSWTVADPGSTVASLAKSGDSMVFTEAVFTAGNDNLLTTASSDYTAWRAYKALTDINGVAVTSDDIADLQVQVTLEAPSGTPAQRMLVVGLCTNPASTAVADLDPVAVGVYQPSTGNANGAYTTAGGQTFLTGGSIAIGNGSITMGGGDVNAVAALVRTVAGAKVSSTATNINTAIASSSPLYLFVALACRANSDGGVEDAELKAKIYAAPVLRNSVSA